MIDNVAYIKKLIYNWCIRDDRYGMTLPNVIGAIRFYNNNVDYTIESFFKDLPEVDLDIKISCCPDLKEFVFGTFKREDAPKNYYEEVNSIFYSRSELNINTYEELTNLFTEKYSNKIQNGLYSKNYNTLKRSGLTKEDKDFLNSIE